MSYVEKAEFRETVEEVRFLTRDRKDKHDALADKFSTFVKEFQEFMNTEIEKCKTELREQIVDTMRDAGAETATHKAEIDQKVEKQADEIKEKVRRQDEENEKRKSAMDSLEGEIKELLTDKRCRNPILDRKS